MPNIDIVTRGILIGFATKLGSGPDVVLAGWKLSGSIALPTTTTRVIRTLQMVFTNPIMTTHVNRATNQPPMNSMVAGGYKSADVVNPKGGYQKPFVVTVPILDHRDGHYVRLNRVALKYPYFKKDVDLDVHVGVFNFIIKANVKNILSMYLVIC